MRKSFVGGFAHLCRIFRCARAVIGALFGVSEDRHNMQCLAVEKQVALGQPCVNVDNTSVDSVIRKGRRKSSSSSTDPLPRVSLCVCLRPVSRYQHSARQAHPVSASVGDTMKVTIKEWNAVAAWRWDMPDDDVCGICRNPYDSTCSKCKFPGDDCPLCMCSCLPSNCAY